ncbi:hypothetical protein [Sulfuriferula nivalis]|uniref:Transmembrane protein n=1 Tax=Sulfuriferula nivalis TaxID=2675298 RepID=A0A809RGQ1_9PROT|nr:hypothetical protein [Sulfuriferula nivalis]BBP00044.1 hypothetical protein SFSGTM_07520 [Sulfuriferula nivalis]
MQPWLKRALFAALATLAIWLLVIAYWRTNMHMPSTIDVATYLVIMPLTLLLSIYIIKRAGNGLLALTTKTENQTVNTNENAATLKAQAEEEAARSWTALITTSAIHTRFGTTASDIIDAIKNKKTKFELDTQLTDTNGYPVLSGRIEDLETDDAVAHFKQFINSQALPEQPWHTEDLRTITLAHNVCQDLSQALLSNPNLNKLIVKIDNTTPKANIPNIYLTSILPSSWTEQQKQQVQLWLLNILSTQGLPSNNVISHPLNASNPDDPLLLIDSINVEINQQPTQGLHIIIASHSLIGDQSNLANNTTHRIPGEAAAGLILTDPKWAETLALSSPVKIHRIAQLNREKSADEAGKINPETLIKTIENAIAIANIDQAAVKTITADSDDRPTRIGELYEAINTSTTDIEPTENCFQIAYHCGETGSVSTLLAVISAADQVQKNEQAALCLCNNDSLKRSAIVINIT